MLYRQNKYYVLLFGLLALLLINTACNTTKFLKPDEQLLVKNTIIIDKSQKVENKRSLGYELTTLYKQKPNGNVFFFFPREWFYYRIRAKSDTTNFDRWQNRLFAERPAIYSENLTEATANNIKYYLQSKGYYDAEVTHSYKSSWLNKKQVGVTYQVQPRDLYVVDTIRFLSRDTAIQHTLNIIREDSYFQKGVGVEQERYQAELNRITNYLRNDGYAFFYPNFIDQLAADTLGVQTDLDLEVFLNADGKPHQRYRIGNLYVYPDYDPLVDSSDLITHKYEGVVFKLDTAYNRVRQDVIQENIFLKKGDWYQQSAYDKTYQQLSTLGVFRYVSIKQEVSKTEENTLDFYIYLTKNKPIEFGANVELNYSDRLLEDRTNLIGTSVSASLRNRNAFRRAALLVGNVGAGIEMNFGTNRTTDTTTVNDRFWNGIDVKTQVQLYVPKFLDYLGFWKKATRIRFGKEKQSASDNFYQVLQEQASTRVGLSYNYLLFLQYYSVHTFNASFGYDVAFKNKRFSINHIGIDYLNPNIKPRFRRDVLSRNEYLQRSFTQQLLTGFILKDFSYATNIDTKKDQGSLFLKVSGEVSGLEVHAANLLYNAVSSSQDTFRLVSKNPIDFARYIKGELDVHFNRVFTPKSSIATRINVGVAIPFGFSSDIPYVKQFYVGGPNSIRAWNARGIGPGGYEDPIASDPSLRLLYYQTGDIKLELNAEYRFQIAKIWSTRIEGAVFFDSGNVWTREYDPDRPQSQFLFSRIVRSDDVVNEVFIKQFAIGTGVGIRMDFSYFIFRLDFGHPLRYPYSLSTGSYWVNRYQRELMTLNFGLNYPF